MKTNANQLFCYLLILFLFGNLYQINASSIEIKDTIKVNATWDVDTVRITGNLYVAATDSLIIKPGTRVEFQGNYSFIIDGIIIAKGAVNDSIVFTIHDTTGFHDFGSTAGGWKYIRVNSYTSLFRYCIFEYGKNITGDTPNIDFSKSSMYDYKNNQAFLSIRNCYSKDTSIVFTGNSISNSELYNNYSNAFEGQRISNSIIRNNRGNGVTIIPRTCFRCCGEGNTIFGSASVCKIYENTGYGISNNYFEQGHQEIRITGNFISDNDGGIIIEDAGVFIDKNKIENQISHGAINLYNTEGFVVNNLIYNNILHPLYVNDSVQSSINIFKSTLDLFSNNTITNNIGVKGGGLYVKNSKVDITGNIFWSNEATIAGNEICIESSSPALTNIKLISNDIENGLEDLFTGTDVTLVSEENIASYPEFTDTINHDFTITRISPCINKGKNYPSFNYGEGYYDLCIYLANDYKNNKRTFNNRIDIGAYEFIPDSVYFAPIIYPRTVPHIVEFCEKSYKSIYLTGIGESYTNVCYQGGQWQKDGVNYGNGILRDVFLENIDYENAGIYSCNPPKTDVNYFEYIVVVVGNKLGEVENNKIIVPGNADTTISLKDLPPLNLKFNWYKDGHLLTDTTSTLSITNVSLVDAGYYYCFIESGCHSAYTDSTNLSIVDTTLNITDCDSFDFNGRSLTSSGTYYDTLPNFAGGDSIIMLNLNILKSSFSTISTSVCREYNFQGKIIFESGTYYDTIPNTAGCDSVITLHLTIPELDTSVVVSVTGLHAAIGNDEYQWIDCENNASPIADATDPSFDPTESGFFAVIVAKEGCADTSACRAYNTTGINPYEDDNNLIIYPNPFRNKATIALNNETLGIDEIMLLNITGEIVFSAKNIHSNIYQINRSDLKPGAYFIIIISGSNIYRKYLVIE